MALPDGLPSGRGGDEVRRPPRAPDGAAGSQRTRGGTGTDDGAERALAESAGGNPVALPRRPTVLGLHQVESHRAVGCRGPPAVMCGPLLGAGRVIRSMDVGAYQHGIYPRSEEVVAATRGRERGRNSQDDVERAFASDRQDFLRVQQEAGLDYFSDGLLRWQDIFRPFVEMCHGLDAHTLVR